MEERKAEVKEIGVAKNSEIGTESFGYAFTQTNELQVPSGIDRLFRISHVVKGDRALLSSSFAPNCNLLSTKVVR